MKGNDGQQEQDLEEARRTESLTATLLPVPAPPVNCNLRKPSQEHDFVAVGNFGFVCKSCQLFFATGTTAVLPGSLRPLLNAVEATEEEGGFKAKMGKTRASNFISSRRLPFSGFGFLGHRPFFDPTDVEEDTRTTKLSTIFSKTIEEDLMLRLAVRTLEESLLCDNDLSSVSETGNYRTVQREHLNEIAYGIFRNRPHRLISGKSLSELNCDEGLVTSASKPDGYFVDSQGRVRGIFEVTGGESPPSEGLRQGAAEATNVAIMQLKLGVNVTAIVVPVVASNGYLMQFGAVIMLQPSFPTFIMLTHVLDLTDQAALTEAARMLCCIKILVSTELALACPPIPHALEKVALSPSRYHCKLLKDFYMSTGAMQSSLYNFFKLMAHLHKDKVCRKFVVFPICVRECNNSWEESAIVYPKLDTSYKIGLPNTPELRAAFMSELRRIIAALHEAGVVHLDLFLSNLMWRQVGPNEVQLKIIDWDSAHFSAKGLSAVTVKRLSETSRRDRLCDQVAVELQVDMGNDEEMTKMYDISLLCVLEKFIDEPSLRVRGKPELDEACQKFQMQYVRVTESEPPY